MKTHRMKNDVMILKPDANGCWYVRMFDATKIAAIEGGTERDAANRFAARVISKLYRNASRYSAPRCIRNYRSTPTSQPSKIWIMSVLTKNQGKFGFDKVRFFTVSK